MPLTLSGPATELSAAIDSDVPGPDVPDSGRLGTTPDRTITVVVDGRHRDLGPASAALPEDVGGPGRAALGSDAVMLSDVGPLPFPSRLGLLRTTSSLLDALSGAGLALLRREVADGLRTSCPVLLCPACCAPLTVAVVSVAEAGTVGGRRAFLKHRPTRTGATPGTSSCPLARGTTTRPPGAVEAQRFDGAQEGAWHASTKAQLFAACLRDEGVGFVAPEVRVPVRTPRGPSWRRADLLVRHEAGTVAIEVQGARPLLVTVAGREADLAGENVGVLWVLDGRCPERLELQGFQDIHGTRGGVVHAWDEGTAAASRAAGRLMLRRWRVAEWDDRLHVAEDSWVTLAQAIAEAVAHLPRLAATVVGAMSPAVTSTGNGATNLPSANGAPIATDLAVTTPAQAVLPFVPNRQIVAASAGAAPPAGDPPCCPPVGIPPSDAALAVALLDAVAQGDDDAAEAAYDLLAARLGLSVPWHAAELDGLPRALGAARTALTGRRGLPYDLAPDRWAATLNSFLSCDDAADWVPLLLRACEGHAAAQARLARDSTARKVAAVRGQVARRPERSQELDRCWGALFARVFPPQPRAAMAHAV